MISLRSSERRRRGTDWQHLLSAIVRYGLLIILSIIFLFPFYIILRNGLSTDQEITSFSWKWFPSTLHFENIQELFDDPSAPMMGGLINSAIIAVIQVSGQLV